jgi:hypothetical protein
VGESIPKVLIRSWSEPKITIREPLKIYISMDMIPASPLTLSVNASNIDDKTTFGIYKDYESYYGRIDSPNTCAFALQGGEQFFLVSVEVSEIPKPIKLEFTLTSRSNFTHIVIPPQIYLNFG